MANLLPREYIKTVHRDRTYRVIVTVLSMLLVVTIMGISFLIPSFMLSRSKLQDAEREVLLAQEFIQQQEQTGVLDETRDTRTMVEHLEVELALISFSDVFAVLDDSLLQGIDLEEVSYAREAEGADQLIVQGIASTREALLSFSRELDSQELFADVEVPVSDLARSTNIAFSFSLNILDENFIPEDPAAGSDVGITDQDEPS